MKVSSVEQGMHGGIVQIANISKGGNSSWAVKEHKREKNNEKESSVRLAWYTEKARFDPISSAELPMWGLKLLTKAAAKHDLLSIQDIKEIISELEASITRRK